MEELPRLAEQVLDEEEKPPRRFGPPNRLVLDGASVHNKPAIFSSDHDLAAQGNQDSKLSCASSPCTPSSPTTNGRSTDHDHDAKNCNFRDKFVAGDGERLTDANLLLKQRLLQGEETQSAGTSKTAARQKTSSGTSFRSCSDEAVKTFPPSKDDTHFQRRQTTGNSDGGASTTSVTTIFDLPDEVLGHILCNYYYTDFPTICRSALVCKTFCNLIRLPGQPFQRLSFNVSCLEAHENTQLGLLHPTRNCENFLAAYVPGAQTVVRNWAAAVVTTVKTTGDILEPDNEEEHEESPDNVDPFGRPLPGAGTGGESSGKGTNAAGAAKNKRSMRLPDPSFLPLDKAMEQLELEVEAQARVADSSTEQEDSDVLRRIALRKAGQRTFVWTWMLRSLHRFCPATNTWTVESVRHKSLLYDADEDVLRVILAEEGEAGPGAAGQGEGKVVVAKEKTLVRLHMLKQQDGRGRAQRVPADEDEDARSSRLKGRETLWLCPPLPEDWDCPRVGRVRENFSSSRPVPGTVCHTTGSGVVATPLARIKRLAFDLALRACSWGEKEHLKLRKAKSTDDKEDDNRYYENFLSCTDQQGCGRAQSLGASWIFNTALRELYQQTEKHSAAQEGMSRCLAVFYGELTDLLEALQQLQLVEGVAMEMHQALVSTIIGRWREAWVTWGLEQWASVCILNTPPSAREPVGTVQLSADDNLGLAKSSHVYSTRLYAALRLVAMGIEPLEYNSCSSSLRAHSVFETSRHKAASGLSAHKNYDRTLLGSCNMTCRLQDLDAALGANFSPEALRDFVRGQLLRVRDAFKSQGFRGANSNEYHHVNSSVLHRSLATKRGMPITLCSIFAVFAEARGLCVTLLPQIPGHVMVRVDGVCGLSAGTETGTSTAPFAFEETAPNRRTKMTRLHLRMQDHFFVDPFAADVTVIDGATNCFNYLLRTKGIICEPDLLKHPAAIFGVASAAEPDGDHQSDNQRSTSEELMLLLWVGRIFRNLANVNLPAAYDDPRTRQPPWDAGRRERETWDAGRREREMEVGAQTLAKAIDRTLPKIFLEFEKKIRTQQSDNRRGQ